MPNSIAQKLKIKEDYAILTINAPGNFRKSLGDLPDGAKIITTPKDYRQIHWFVMNRAQMEKEIKKVMALVKEEVICWIYYPKGTSGIQTDLSRDRGWEILLKNDHLQWISLISFDDTWSAFGMRLKTATDKKKETKPIHRAIFDYIDPEKKTIRLPENFEKELKKNKKQLDFFNALSFTNKKEYVEWIVSAKREETRVTRIKESIERLGKQWKNPANR
jgi:hypothetical protein